MESEYFVITFRYEPYLERFTSLKDAKIHYEKMINLGFKEVHVVKSIAEYHG